MIDEKGYRYLYHITKEKNIESICKCRMLYAEYDRYKHNIQVDGVYSTTRFDYAKPWSVSPGQYPGLYMSLMDRLPDLEKDEIALIFPTELLFRQKNWHFNLFDRNGTFGYDTYTCQTIIDLPPLSRVKKFYMEKVGRYHNEVVFHDSIDLRNCQFVYDGEKIHSLVDYTNIDHQFEVDERPGAFLYYSDRWYTGIHVPYYCRDDESTTSVEFYRDYVKRYIDNIDLSSTSTKREIEDIVADADLFTKMYTNRYR